MTERASGLFNTSEQFPIAHLEASRHDERLQARHSSEVASVRAAYDSIQCPMCQASADKLAWYYFESPPVTWERLCGRAGIIAFCDRDQFQVKFVMTMMN